MKINISKEWIMSRIHLEEGQSIEAGSPHVSCSEVFGIWNVTLGRWVNDGDADDANSHFTADNLLFAERALDAIRAIAGMGRKFEGRVYEIRPYPLNDKLRHGGE